MIQCFVIVPPLYTPEVVFQLSALTRGHLIHAVGDFELAMVEGRAFGEDELCGSTGAIWGILLS